MRESRPRVGRRFKIWQMVALVVVSALVFGAIRAIADDIGPLNDKARSVLVSVAVIMGFWMVVAGAWLAISIALARRRLARTGQPLFDWPTVSIRRWGLERGGVVGFLIWLAAIVLDLVAFLTVVLILVFASPILVGWMTGW